MDKDADAAYATAVRAALRLGVNLVDTAINYRHQRSERSVSEAVQSFVAEDGGSRDEIVVCTKGGFLVPGAITPGTLEPSDVVDGMHSLAPAFLADQIDRSRRNLALETIDVYFIHNPETQLGFVEATEFARRIRDAFEVLERAAAAGSIQYYGTATWNGYRDSTLSLTALADIAQEIAGANHHFRFVQLPFNLGMQEALTRPVERGASLLDLAADLGITVIASAALLQARLTRDLPDEVVRMLPGLESDAQRAIQYTRSAPGIASALVGMRKPAHVEENLAVSATHPLTAAEFRALLAVL